MSVPESDQSLLPKTEKLIIRRFGMTPREGIAAIIDLYAARIRSIKNCAEVHIPLATESVNQWKDNVKDRIPKAVIGVGEGLVVINNAFHAEIENHLLTAPSQILAQALLGAGFSAFDAFLSRFLASLYREERNMLRKLAQREVKLEAIIECKSMDDALDTFVQKNVSDLIRESYTTIFDTLGKWHGPMTLTSFDSWPAFIEASQRRHLFTHCDGEVSQQYCDACKAAGHKLPDGVTVGTKLKVDKEYLARTLDMLYEVIVMLGITLWRTASKKFVAPAEVFMTDEIYMLLDREQWGLAVHLGLFTLNLKKPESELQLRITRINYAQALKWTGDQKGAVEALEQVDWTSCSRDLRLGVAVISEDYDTAANLMKQIGKDGGESVTEVSYRLWPIFREFRKTDIFKRTFKEIFGEDFADKTSKGTIADSVPPSTPS